ncbi:MAG: butyrate kinase [Oscillospiraceae bacterium]|nr:butyrate kinase [Oscillospiraceae bacterium]
MGKKIRVLAINPGSTTTKIALFDDFDILFSTAVVHSPQDLSKFADIQDQLEYRTKMVAKSMAAHGYAMEDVDVYAGRGGGLRSVAGGVYTVTDLLAKHAATGMNGMHHPAQLGSQIAKKFADKYGKPAFIVNPPDVDEFSDVARVTGIKGLYRESHLHALNQKETAARFCASRGLKYEETNLIICHTGGGISITAHKKGQMIDSNDIIKGSGPMSPTRAGDLPYMKVLDLAYSGQYTKTELTNKLNRNGGLTDYFGTSDMDEVYELIKNGDSFVQLIVDGMIYQHAKYVGSMAAALKGKVDAIILTGGISNNAEFTKNLTEYISWIAEVVVMPGEYELQALASGAIRVLRGEVEAKEYTGVPVWGGFE